MKADRFWRSIGGRKNANGYLFALLITVMVFLLDGEFDSYAMWLAAALLGTSAIIAAEDRKQQRRPGARRASDPAPTEDGAVG